MMACIRRLAADLGLDGIERADLFEDVGAQRRGDTLVQVEHLATEVGPARHLGRAAPVKAVIPGIGVSLEKAAEAGEMRQRVCSGAVGREAIPCRAQRRAARRPVVGCVNP